MVLNGIDVSGFQPSNIGALVAADFVLIKASEGTDYVSASMASQVSSASGKLLGFYHFADGSGAEAEASAFVAALKSRIGSGVLVLDWESTAVAKGVAYAKTFLDAVKAATGVTPIIYMSASVVSAYDWSSVSGTYPLWVASYGANPVRTAYAPLQAPTVAHWPSPVLYQYGSRGRLSGYSGNLDLDIFFGTKAAWSALATGAQTPNPVDITTFEEDEMFLLENNTTGDYFTVDRQFIHHVGTTAEVTRLKNVMPFYSYNNTVCHTILGALGIPTAYAKATALKKAHPDGEWSLAGEIADKLGIS